MDPQQLGQELGAKAVLVGKIYSRPPGVAISAELVDASTGWQLWGGSFDSEGKDILQIPEAITRQLLGTLKLTLTRDEERRVTVRYTENADAYRASLEGRYDWSRYPKREFRRLFDTPTRPSRSIRFMPWHMLTMSTVISDSSQTIYHLKMTR